jgi:hypothetical protein
VAFTGTTAINSHIVRETAEIGLSQDAATAGAAEAALQSLFDALAAKHGMHCIICDPLSMGRVYSENDKWLSLALTANFDSTNSSVWYDIRTSSMGMVGGLPKAKEVDALQVELQDALRTSYPSINIAVAAYPKDKLLQVGVRKKEPFTSHRDGANQDDYKTALGIVGEVARREGLQQISESMYGIGRLFGPSQIYRDLTVRVDIADSPLVGISIYCRSSECADRQRFLAQELERRLQETFGADRASIR